MHHPRRASLLLLPFASALLSRDAAAAPTALDVDVHYTHACATTSCGDALCWGDNGFGQATSRIIPRGQLTPPPRYTSITTGLLHTCSIMSSRVVACWGDNSSGQRTPPPQFATASLNPGYSPAEIDAGWFHTCATTGYGSLACWGDNSSGQSSPPAAPFDDDYVWVDVSAGAWHSCGLMVDGRIACWGADDDDQSFGHAIIDEAWLLPNEEFVDVEVGDQHSCALTDHGHIYCWGSNDDGQLYDAQNDFDWAEVVPGFYRATTIEFDRLVVGAVGTCGFAGAQSVCWGAPFDTGAPYLPPAGSPSDAAYVANFGCKIDGAGGLSCWGYGPPAPALGSSCGLTLTRPRLGG